MRDAPGPACSQPATVLPARDPGLCPLLYLLPGPSAVGFGPVEVQACWSPRSSGCLPVGCPKPALPAGVLGNDRRLSVQTATPQAGVPRPPSLRHCPRLSWGHCLRSCPGRQSCLPPPSGVCWEFFTLCPHCPLPATARETWLLALHASPPPSCPGTLAGSVLWPPSISDPTKAGPVPRRGPSEHMGVLSLSCAGMW